MRSLADERATARVASARAAITQATANNLAAEKTGPTIFRSAMSSYPQQAADGWYVAAKLDHKRIAVVGLDYVADHEQTDGFIKTFMESGVVLLEGSTCREIVPRRYEMVCFPLRLRGLDGAL